ncbi:hypothetical protein DPMN_060976 [Dreissena polymorpha]|uniref:Uncharacterized protein n=1 Tax=Dreissena polymorpha TaxID=45954 RepID=A0A9D4C6Q9_DREPO|nr:hypothetical protein DPMN_060976 [Dreissena polymorpha]
MSNDQEPPKLTKKSSPSDDHKTKTLKNANNSKSCQKESQKVAEMSSDQGGKSVGQFRGAFNTGHRLAQKPEHFIEDVVDETKFLLPQGKDSTNLSSLSIGGDDLDCGSDYYDQKEVSGQSEPAAEYMYCLDELLGKYHPHELDTVYESEDHDEVK